jgi:hypothetical protein
MSRSHVAVLGRCLQALGVAAGYVAVAAGLFWLDLGDAGEAPAWAAVAVPLVYAALSLVLLRGASPARNLKWTGGACLTHVALGAAAGVAFTMIVDVTALSGLAHALARLGPVPLLTFVATPLVLAPFGGREVSVRTAPRRERARAATTTPVVRASAVTVSPTNAAAPTAATAPAASSEMPTLRDPRPRKLIVDAEERAASVASSASAKSSEPVTDMPGDDVVVRVRFERIAGQLPARAFTLPLDRVAESLREPHWITVPRRIVLEQLPEGAIQVPWPIVAAQFPELAFAMTDVEFRQKFPDLKLTLPLDDVLRQLPRGMFSMEPTPSAIAGLEAFPPPFQPLAVPREAPVATATPGETPELPPGVVAATAPAAPPPPVGASRPAPPPSPPVAAPAPPPVVTPPPPPSSVAPSAAPAPRRAAASDVVGRDALTQLVACLAGAGAFEAWTGVVDDTPLVAFVEPAVSHDAVTAVAARVAGLLGAAAGEQVTVRTARAAIIVSAAPTPIVVAARRPGAPVALLELRAARAASQAGRASEGAALPSRTLSALTVEPRVAAVASALGESFGLVDPAVLADAGGGARVYVFRESGREAAHLGQLALAVWEGLGRAPDGDLGAVVSVVFRQGRRRILVRPVGGRGPALLAAAGPVARPGRAWRDADRAAAALETR